MKHNRVRFLVIPTLVFVFLFVAVNVSVLAQYGDDNPKTATLGGNDVLGAFLVDANGVTLYTFTNDTPNTSNCAGECLAAWPALTVESTDALVSDVTGQWGVIERAEGALQVTFNRMPLYTFANDAASGDANGQGAGDVWFVARPQVLGLGSNEELGSFLVNSAEMTVYTFANDTEGVSNCSGECLTAWPAVTVGSEDELIAGLGATAQADLDVIERADTGDLQVTYKGAPLYTFANDAASGDATGDGAGDVWFVVKPTTASVGSNEELGEFLVASDGMTLYTFTNDADGVSNCNGECAVAWPALTVASADDLIAGEGVSGEFGTIEREDGSLQVTYNGAPLYFFVNDVAAGDANGQGLGDVWFVAVP